MEAMAEANEDAKEIDEAVRIGGDVALGVEGISSTDEELEEELKRLVTESDQEKEQWVDKKLAGISEVPPGTQAEHRSDSEREAVLL